MALSTKITKLQAAVNRLREPSSMAGLSVIGLLASRQVTDVSVYLDLLAGLLASLAIIFPERRQ